MLSNDDVHNIAKRVERLFGRTFVTRVYDDGDDYRHQKGDPPPSIAFFGNRVMRVVKHSKGVPHWGSFEVKPDMMAALMLHEIGHFLVAPRDTIMGFTVQRLYKHLRHKEPGHHAFNIMHDIMLDWHMMANQRVRKEFGDDFMTGTEGIFEKSHPGSMHTHEFHKYPLYPPGGNPIGKYASLGILRARGGKPYQDALAHTSPTEKRFIETIEPLAGNPVVSPQAFYAIDIQAMDYMLQMLGATPVTGVRGGGGSAP